MRNFLRMLSFVRPYKGKFMLFVVCAVCFSAFNSSLFFLARNFLQEFFADPSARNPEALYFLSVTFFLVFVIIGYFEWRRIYLAHWIAARCVMDVNNQVMANLVRMELAYFDRRRSGDLISRIASDSAALQQTVQMLAMLVREPITLLTLFVTALVLDWRLTLIGSIGLPLATVALRPLLRRIRRSSRRGRETMGERVDSLTQFFGGVRIVKAYGLEKNQQTAYEAVNGRIFKYELKRASANALSRPMLYFLVGIGLGLAILYGGKYVYAGSLDPGTFFTAVIALLAMQRPLKSLLGAVNKATDSLPGAERVFELIDAKPAIVDLPDARELKRFTESIRLENVSFNYDRECVLKDINLEITAGQTVAFVGPSGAGKSTLVSLIGRLYEPTAGTIYVDGIDQRQIRQSSLLAQIAVVTQEPFLFNTTIRENIRHGRSGATDAEIEQAARAANIHDEILAFPRGYDTLAGERGMQLSGGQRQRVAIARAVLRGSPILILDEATSSLDSESEHLVQQAIERLVVNRTSLIIAHRLSTVTAADMIVVLDQGRIVGRGSHEQLLETNDVYRRLWAYQSGDGAFAGRESDTAHEDEQTQRAPHRELAHER